VTIHVLVPVHNRADFTEQFLVSVDEQNADTTVRVLIIDDGSSDRTPQLVRSRGVDVLTGKGSWWWAGSIQRGLAAIASTMRLDDYVYLGNNDTILAPGHLQSLLDEAKEHPRALIGSVSNEIWPDGTINPVSAGFFVRPETLTVKNAGVETRERLDALAGRGILIPAAAAQSLRLSPRRMPQHFADLSATYRVRKHGFDLRIESAAVSTQLERAGSSVEIRPSLASALSKRSSIYVPAMMNFWWDVSTPWQRTTLPARALVRGMQQLRSGAYS
jgi:GT2 family glycosyltransferase